MHQKYSILINSCDKYSDVWPMFFHIFKKTWTSNFPRIFLSTEEKQVVCEDLNIQCLNISDAKTKDIPWGERLKDCLARIDSDYVLMLLEDFYFESEIDVNAIDKCVDYLNKNNDIIAFQFLHASKHRYSNKAERNEFYGFLQRRRLSKFLINAGPALWRKSDLINLTKDTDNPWEWEYFGSFRTWFYGKKIYCWADESKKIFDYDFVHGGAVHRGKWVGYKLRELSEKYSFPLDYGDREIEEDWMKSETRNKKEAYFKRLPTIIVNRIKIVINIFAGIKTRFLSKKREKSYETNKFE